MNKTTMKDTYEEFQYDMEINGKMKRGLSFISKWTTDDTLKTKKGVTFAPREDVPRYFNLFDKFAYEDIEEGEGHYLDEIFELIRHICGYDEEMFQKTLMFLGDILQRPNEKRYGRCLIFTGAQGTGKTAFWNWFGENIIGINWYHLSRDVNDYTGRFAGGVVQKLLCVMEEMSGRDGFEVAEKLKDNITGTKIGYEEKYKAKITVANRARFVMLSNNDTPAKIENGDRRFEPAKSSTKYKGDQSYWDMIWNVVFPHKPTQKAFAEYLLKVNLKPWKDHDNKVKKDMLISTVKPIERFFIDITSGICLLLEEDEKEEDVYVETLRINDIHNAYKEWAKDNAEHLISKIKLGKMIRNLAEDIEGLSFGKIGGGHMEYIIDKKKIHESITSRLM